jgi:hypothetical protein
MKMLSALLPASLLTFCEYMAMRGDRDLQSGVASKIRFADTRYIFP